MEDFKWVVKLHVVFHGLNFIMTAMLRTFDTFLTHDYTTLGLQKHHPAALLDHHPGKEISQSPDVPGGPEEYLRGSQSQVGEAESMGSHQRLKRIESEIITLILFYL